MVPLDANEGPKQKICRFVVTDTLIYISQTETAESNKRALYWYTLQGKGQKINQAEQVSMLKQRSASIALQGEFYVFLLVLPTKANVVNKKVGDSGNFMQATSANGSKHSSFSNCSGSENKFQVDPGKFSSAFICTC